MHPNQQLLFQKIYFITESHYVAMKIYFKEFVNTLVKLLAEAVGK